MASTKIMSLLVRTLAKPISSSIKERAKDHPKFREMTIGLAQSMHKIDMRLRAGVLAGATPKHIRPLNDAKAISLGANFLAEGFLFAVAVALIIGETVRGRIKTANRRDTVDDKLDDLAAQLQTFQDELNEWRQRVETHEQDSDRQIGQLTSQIDQLIDVGRRGGWISQAVIKNSESESAATSSASVSASASPQTDYKESPRSASEPSS